MDEVDATPPLSSPSVGHIYIRPATESDLPFILTTIHLIASYESLDPARVTVTEASLRRTLFTPGTSVRCIIAYSYSPDDPHTDLGLAIYHPNFDTFSGCEGIYMKELFVLEEARGRGVGRQLMRWLGRKVLQTGGKLEWNVLKWNEKADGFYISVGGQRFGGMRESEGMFLDQAGLRALVGVGTGKE